MTLPPNSRIPRRVFSTPHAAETIFRMSSTTGRSPVASIINNWAGGP